MTKPEGKMRCIVDLDPPLTEHQKVILCAAINGYGDNDHPMADFDSLPYFRLHYVRTCVQRIWGNLPSNSRERKILSSLPDDLKP